VKIHHLLPFTFVFAMVSVSVAQQGIVPLWKNGPPESVTTPAPEHDITSIKDPLIAGRKIIKLTDVGEPTLAVYKPDPARNSGAAVLVFPGGGYQILAYDLEGTEVCTWLNSIRITCVLVKYRVPYGGHYPERFEDLEDAQQAMRLTRIHAVEWGIDPRRIGVLGFSAGGHLVAVLSIHYDFVSKAAAVKEHGGLDASISARPDFAFIIYPGYLVHWPDKTTIAPEAVPTGSTPPTFILQAEDDPVHVENASVYFQALKEAGVPAEVHLFAAGGHGYGLRPTSLPITHWPALAETWLHTIQMLP
jgi:acetyl esterase/lipase